MQECFSNGKWNKNVTTVGEMVDEMSRLPRGLKVKQGFSPSADLVVFNRDGVDRHLSMDEGGQWDEDVDIESQIVSE
jgi:hypothetical protein